MIKWFERVFVWKTRVSKLSGTIRRIKDKKYYITLKTTYHNLDFPEKLPKLVWSKITLRMNLQDWDSPNLEHCNLKSLTGGLQLKIQW